MMESIFCYAVGFRNWENFLEIFWYFRNSRAVVNDCLWAFSCFFFRVFNCSFLLFESIRHWLARYQKLVFPWKYYFEYVNFIKQLSLGVNFWGTNCPKFQKFSLGKLILLELIQKKYLRSFSFIVWLGKLIHLWNLMRY